MPPTQFLRRPNASTQPIATLRRLQATLMSPPRRGPHGHASLSRCNPMLLYASLTQLYAASTQRAAPSLLYAAPTPLRSCPHAAPLPLGGGTPPLRTPQRRCRPHSAARHNDSGHIYAAGRPLAAVRSLNAVPTSPPRRSHAAPTSLYAAPTPPTRCCVQHTAAPLPKQALLQALHAFAHRFGGMGKIVLDLEKRFGDTTVWKKTFGGMENLGEVRGGLEKRLMLTNTSSSHPSTTLSIVLQAGAFAPLYASLQAWYFSLFQPPSPSLLI